MPELQERSTIGKDARRTQGSRPLLKQYFVKDMVCPTEKVRWVQREVPELGNGKKHFVEAPENWSDKSTTIAAVHYLAPIDADSLRSMILRVSTNIRHWAEQDEIFDTADQLNSFQHELTYILLHRIGSFNSPVWYNLGVDEHPLVSACFINSVSDSMESITDLNKTEARIFQRGAGAGCNWSKLRSSYERVRGMGYSSGPVGFMMGLDRAASVIKSGGRKRRAARIDILDISHPNVPDFIMAKAEVEEMARVLVKQGWSTDMNDPKSTNNILPHQSTNVSVRIPDAFMQAYEENGKWQTHTILDGKPHNVYQARDLFRQIAEACWKCGDPGVQYDDTINRWSNLQDIHHLNGSNPCGEFVSIDDSACNLASINVLPPNRDPLTTEELKHVSRVFITAMDTLVGHASYPTEAIANNANKYRDLGLGWTNLGARAMYEGYAYDSDEARHLVAGIVSTTTATAYDQSMNLAQKRGSFHRASECVEGISKVFEQHWAAAGEAYPSLESVSLWADLLDRVKRGELPRNATVTLCAPTGTIGLLMDCDTTGPEPALGLKTTKKLSYGGEMILTIRAVKPALERLGYDSNQIDAVLAQIKEAGHVEGVVREEHLPVFDTALPSGPSKRTIHYMGHLKMLAAMQPHLSMAISKTVNLPEEVTVEDIEKCFYTAWKLGIKNVALYRDMSKVAQAVYAGKLEPEKKKRTRLWGERKKLPRTRRNCLTHKVDLGGTEVYLHVSCYPDTGLPGEIFFTANCGSTIDGMLDSLAKAFSLGLQHGAPLDKLVEKYKGTKFAPDGWVDNHHYSSLMDYAATKLEEWFLTEEGEGHTRVPIPVEDFSRVEMDLSHREPCPRCGEFMMQSGGSNNCFLCHNCGETQGGCG